MEQWNSGSCGTDIRTGYGGNGTGKPEAEAEAVAEAELALSHRLEFWSLEFDAQESATQQQFDPRYPQLLIGT